MNNFLLIHDFLKKYKKLFVNELFIPPKAFAKEEARSNSAAKYELTKYENICEKY